MKKNKPNKQNTKHKMNKHNKEKKTKTQKQKKKTNNTATFIPRTRCWSASSRAPTFGGLLIWVRFHHTATERKPSNVFCV